MNRVPTPAVRREGERRGKKVRNKRKLLAVCEFGGPAVVLPPSRPDSQSATSTRINTSIHTSLRIRDDTHELKVRSDLWPSTPILICELRAYEVVCIKEISVYDSLFTSASRVRKLRSTPNWPACCCLSPGVLECAADFLASQILFSQIISYMSVGFHR